MHPAAAILAIILQEGWAGLTHGRRLQPRPMGRLEERVHQKERAVVLPHVVVVQVVENRPVLGEDGLREVHVVRRRVFAGRSWLVFRIAVESVRGGIRTRGKGCTVHHGEGREDGVVVCEAHASLIAQLGQIGRVLRRDRVGTQAVPNEDDDFPRVGRGRIRASVDGAGIGSARAIHGMGCIGDRGSIIRCGSVRSGNSAGCRGAIRRGCAARGKGTTGARRRIQLDRTSTRRNGTIVTGRPATARGITRITTTSRTCKRQGYCQKLHA